MALVLFAGLLLARTWMSWPNPTVDSARELMIPARVAAGERLYSEVVAHYGPVSVWLHAAANRTVGLRVETPLVLLLPLAAGTLASLYVLVRRAAGPLAAFSGTLLGLAIALVAPNGGALVFPYSFAAAHSLAFSTMALALASSRSRFAGTASAVLWGLALAAKPEFALASMAAALSAEVFRGRPAWRFPRRSARACLGAAGVGLALYALAFRGIPLSSLALEGPLVLFDPPEEWRNVYRIVSGLDDARRSMRGVLTAAFLALALAAAIEAGTRLPRRPGTRRLVFAAAAAVAAAAVGTLLGTEFGRTLDQALPPLLRAAPAALCALACLAAIGRVEVPPALLPLLVVGSLGAIRVLLGFTYGWVATPYSSLVAPGVAAATAAAAFSLLPGRGPLLALAFTAGAALQAGRLFIASEPSRLATLTTPRGNLRIEPDRAAALQAALDDIARRAEPGDTLAGFPEAGLFNFSFGLPNPLRQDQVLPGHLDAGAEQAVIARLRERRPRFVVLVNQPSAAFGPVSFGNDYAVRLWSTVLEGWSLVSSFGAADAFEPVGPGPFFVRVYERRETPSRPPSPPPSSRPPERSALESIVRQEARQSTAEGAQSRSEGRSDS